jgi:hypothetical protein
MRTSLVLSSCLVAGALAAAGACGPGGDDDPGACVHILPGDLVITEVFADYAAPPGGSGADEGKEWFEIYNPTGAPIDLQDLAITHGRPDGARPRTHVMASVTVPAGGYLVLGNVAPEFVTGHLDYGYGTGLGDLFNNDGGKLRIACGDRVIDEAIYDNVRAGRSVGFTGALPPDYIANDDLTLWCQTPNEAAYEYTPANYGTPGAPNYACPGGPSGMCDDGGALRDPRAPAVGDLVITEVMPDPAVVADAQGEWFELYATAAVDLNGLQVGPIDGTNPGTVASARCLALEAGDYALLARNADPEVNGGLPDVMATFSVNLANAPGSLQIAHGGVVLDTYAWPNVRAGRSRQLDVGVLDAVGNDDPTAWCDGRTPIGEGASPDLGTPGAANLTCGLTCRDADTGMMRPARSPMPGQLVITEIHARASAPQADKDWFEARATASFDLNGLVLRRTGTTTGQAPIVQEACLAVNDGDYVLFARSAVTEANGGLPPVDATFTTFVLPDTCTAPNCDIRITRADGTLIDAATWTAATNLTARQLDPDILDAVGNDDEGNWCDATTLYNATDRGTPKLPNDVQCD